MGFFKDLAKSCKSAVIEGSRQGLVNGLINSNKRTSTALPDAMQTLEEIKSSQYIANGLNFMSNLQTSRASENISSPTKINYNALGDGLRKEYPYETKDKDIILNLNSDKLGFKFPDWSYADWINERSIWQRGLTSIGGEPGWFYFKIFFDFDTQYGLLGGLLNNIDIMHTTTSAAKFLHISKELYSSEKLSHRLTALYKFANTLSYIQSNAPWFFKSIKGLDKASTDYTEDFSKEKSIEIVCGYEGIDLRLNTLLDLYKYVCYDDINCKEILPDNLRKFDMTVVVFNTPLKKLQTSMSSISAGTFKYKNISGIEGYDNVMTYKMFTFKNCEISKENLGLMMPGDISNETPFQLGNSNIKIIYDRVYTHTSNEFMQFVFGSNGIYYNNSSFDNEIKSNYVVKSTISRNKQELRYKALRAALTKFSFTPSNKDAYKELIDASEEITNHIIHKRNAIGTDIGTNVLLKLLKSSYSSNTILGSLYGDVGPQSDYFKDKLKRLKNKDKYSPSYQTKSMLSTQGANNFNFKEYLLNKSLGK